MHTIVNTQISVPSAYNTTTLDLRSTGKAGVTRVRIPLFEAGNEAYPMKIAQVAKESKLTTLDIWRKRKDAS